MNERLALLLSLALGLLAAGVIAWLGSSSSEPSVDESREVASQDLVLAPRADVEDGATGPGLEGRAPEQLPGAVQGLVIDAETELPLAGVSVMAVPLWEHGESARGVTDAEGRYEVRVPHGAYDLTTWLPGYVSAGLAESARGRRESPLIVHVVEDAPRAEAPTIRLRRGLSLRVRVVEGATNEPVPHASVRFRGTGTRVLRWAAPSQLSEPPAEASYSAELPTDAHGELSLTVLPSPLADWSLGAVAPGRISAWQALGPEGPWDVELRLVQGARLAGRVVDTSGAGVPDVSIEPEPLDEAFESVWILPSLPTVTSREGAFVIEPVAPGSCRLVARFLDPEARAGGVQVLDLKAGEVRAGIEIVVPTRHVLRGTLVDGTGSPVRDGPLRVRVTTAHENVHISLGFGRSDTRGRVALPLPHTGPWTVELSTPLGWYELAAGVKLPSQELTLRAPTEVVTSFSLQVGEADGTPIDWFRVSAFSLAGDSHRARMEHSFVASSDGPEMHIDVPGPLPLAVAVSAQVGDTLDRRTMLLLLRELPADGVVRVRWSNSTGLAGVVRSEDGSPLPDTMVRVSSAESGRGAHRKDTQTDAQGAFLLPYSPEMDIVTRVEVIPPSPWLAPSPVVHDFTTGPLEVVVQRGATLVGRFETPEPVRFDPEDQIQVRWLVGDTQLELGRGAWARVEPDGRFAVHGLPSDRDLVWSYVGATLQRNELVLDAPPQNVRAGDELVLRTVRGLRIAGHVTSAQGLDGLHLRVRWAGAGDATRQVNMSAAGTFELTRLSPGTYELVVVDGQRGGMQLAEVLVEAGREDVEIELPPTTWLEIQVDRPVGHLGLWVREAGGPFPLEAVSLRGQQLGRVRVLQGRRYDVALSAHDGRDRALAAYVGGVHGGRTVNVALRDAHNLHGSMTAEVVREIHGLQARSGSTAYPLSIPHTHAFSGRVEPGRYDIVGTDRSGREHVLARDVQSGRTDIVLEMGR